MVDFNEYYLSQKNDAGEDNGGWTQQMIDAILVFAKNYPKNSKILDLGCHTGRGLEALKNCGYTDLVGVDLIAENVQSVNKFGVSGVQADMHDLSMFSTNYFDALFMSHAIEHAIDPVKVLKECFRISKDGLIIFPLEEYSLTRCSPPHYYVFRTTEDVFEVIKLTGETNKNIIYEYKNRLGPELWIYFKGKKI
jgi:ubiquinone/menaquinone biosynthesis C-methylase UbiE